MVTTFDKEQTRQLLSYRLELGLTQMEVKPRRLSFSDNTAKVCSGPGQKSCSEV